MILLDTIDIDYERSTLSLGTIYFFTTYLVYNLR